MSDWASGYVADINYTYGYYTELNPLRVALCFINAGIRPPEVVNACELGFGQGISANIHAAASEISWYGTDFNPHQAAFAHELLKVSGADAKFYDDAFNEFCQRDDLPDFDYIGLHGIWSWISNENRAVITNFIRRKLKVGGVLYISYNSQPGWAAMGPMRDLLAEHADLMGAPGAGTFARVEGALAFVEKLVAVNPDYCKVNPQIQNRLEKINLEDKHYVAHEYFNRDWEPMAFSKMARWLEPAKIEWACSAYYIDSLDSIQLSAEQRTLLQDIPNSLFRQSVRDFCENRQFRADYWVKGGRRLSGLNQQEALDQLRVVMAVPRKDVEMKIAGRLGEFDLPSDSYAPILEALSTYCPIRIGKLWQIVKESGISRATMCDVITVLAAKNVIQAAQPDHDIETAKVKTDRINFYLLDQSRSTNELGYLASPVTGGGVQVPLVHQFFLLSVLNGAEEPEALAQFAWGILSSQENCLFKDGKLLPDTASNVAELKCQAESFLAEQLPVYRALKLI